MKCKVRFIRKGHCCACGDCCDPLFNEIRNKTYMDAGLEYQRVNRDKDAGEGCSAFNKDTRLCKIYGDRPSSCRAFPLHPVEVKVLPRCTFTFEERP